MIAAKFRRSPRSPAALWAFSTLLIASTPAFPSRAQQHDHAAASIASTICTANGFGKVHHPVKTSVPQAQRLLEQAMALDYGFNHGQAEQCFPRSRAARSGYAHGLLGYSAGARNQLQHAR